MIYGLIKEGFSCLTITACLAGSFYCGTVFKDKFEDLPIVGKDYKVIETQTGNKYYDKKTNMMYDIGNVKNLQHENLEMKKKISEIQTLFENYNKTLESKINSN